MVSEVCRTEKTFIDTLWDGEHFCGLVPETGERILSKSLIHYMPGVLGDRLPREIADKLVNDLGDPAVFNSPYGIASERLDSEFWAPPKWGLGSVIAPLMLFLCTGLWQTRRRADVRRFIENYCAAAARTNLPLFIDAKTGEGLYPDSSWTCCVYLILARLLGE